MSEDTSSVKVAVRVRPLVDSEKQKGSRNIIEVIDSQVVVRNPFTEKSFTFNYAFDSTTNQDVFYDTCIHPLIGNLFKGFNVTILAYGQTGSGKTHTMGTAHHEQQDAGVIPRVGQEIFDRIRDNFSYSITVTVSFLELYQETLYDLLSARPREQSILEIREDNKGIIIPNLTELPVSNVQEILKFLQQGSVGRITGSTAMNSHSSRSHAIFTINICMNSKSGENKQARLNLVDLAGSERLKKTGAVGTTLKEGININKGLLVLGNVIGYLGDEKTKNGYIPYRDSNLTRLLKDSLGGNSITLMIACISPADYNLDETISTLRYADKARKIQNKPIVNQDPKLAEINNLKRTIQQLKLQIVGQGGPVVNVEEIEELKRSNTELKIKLKGMSQQLSNALVDNSGLHEKIILLQSYNDNLSLKISTIKEQYDAALKGIGEATTNNDIDEVKTYLRKFQEIHGVFETAMAEQRVVEEEIRSHESAYTQAFITEEKNLEGSIDEESVEELNQKQEKHTDVQMKLNQQLLFIQRDLACKEALAKQLLENNKSIVDIQEMADNELKIAQLEKEKSELVQKLKQVGNSGKMAEHHRKRVQELEGQLAQLNKKLKEQSNILRMKEREGERIKKLNEEILQMKQMKVKLIRSMREEAEKYRRWRTEKERMCAKLKQQERKKDNELAKIKAMHSKQQIVFKRRVEQAEALNRRLKSALSLRQQVHETKKGKQEEKLEPWLKQEYDLYISLVEARATLSTLLEDRATLQHVLDEMKDSANADPAQIKSIEDDIELRSIQIQDLQQKLLDSGEDNHFKQLDERFQTMVEAKYAVKFLFSQAGEATKDKLLALAKMNEIQDNYNEEKEKNKSLVGKISSLEDAHKVELIQQQQVYEEKIAVLLKHIKEPPSDAICGHKEVLEFHTQTITSQEQKIDELKNQIEELLKEMENLKQHQQRPVQQPVIKIEAPEGSQVPEIQKVKSTSEFLTPPPLPVKRERPQVAIDDSPFVVIDDELKDPDWRKTPLGQRVMERRQGVKRSSTGHCSCKATCTRKCGCRKTERVCTSACKCKCSNKEEVEKTEQSNAEESSVVVKTEDQDENAPPGKLRRTRRLFHMDL